MTTIAAALLLSSALLGCHTAKVTRATAVADSIANAQKIKHLIDSIRREKIIAEGRARWEQERAEAMKQHSQNRIDSIKLGVADGREFVLHFHDSVMVYYSEVQVPTILKEVFPNVFFYTRSIGVAPVVMDEYDALFNSQQYYPECEDFNKLYKLAGNKSINDTTLIKAFIVWRNMPRSLLPEFEITSITKMDTTRTKWFNYLIITKNAISNFQYLKYENGEMQNYMRLLTKEY